VFAFLHRDSAKEMMNNIMHKVDAKAKVSQITTALLLNVKVEWVSMFSQFRICNVLTEFNGNRIK
jgi:hypothetical protein